MHDIDIDDRDYELLFGSDVLSTSDAVVHFDHGLARYDGEEVVTTGDIEQTLTRFVYRHGGKLMLPATEGKDFWRYGAPAKSLSLDRLKTNDWQRRRDEMIRELQESISLLIVEDQQRRAIPARSITADQQLYERFEQSFQYEETADQSRAVTAVLKDLSTTEPMNRLLVGDVGFGKTEVALRAAAAVVSAGCQVVVAAPTTVLARQHFESFKTRFASMDVRVAELSRLTTEAEKQALIEDLAAGRLQVLVGTQALLSGELKFQNLALVVIDEEQKFGAEQKVGLRNLVPGLHVLSMTATPIPRSLAAVEIGLMTVSVVATPPRDRVPIETTVLSLEFDKVLEAIAAEKARGGQCYLVCPRVSGVRELKRRLAQSNIDFTFSIAHGQMSDERMTAAMLKFMSGAVDVLLSTSIVESGLDNGRANTMIVWNADRFGLAQLHQLRGRVGRSIPPGRMLLFTKVDTDGTSVSAERLRSFSTLSHLGSGFEISRRDRELRGFGELDGESQSGQLSRLGIGLYRHVLQKHRHARSQTTLPSL
ncbi:DEAD/DEAH box helicase [Allohahella sp. A8]|uniref:DEAD/DEAH box helicase n=1 Tax=Allohahella sp. A8 TaxID=3141461 RepID=UPI003A80F9C6